MNEDILISKIVGSPNETTWSQASSAGKLYITITIQSHQESHGIVGYGKEKLEQIQREFFALDEKNLVTIKNAVKNVADSIGEEFSYSIIIATIISNILYIVTADEGIVVIDRQDNLAEVARGESGKIIGFSGELKNDDIIVLETKGFHDKISHKLLAEYTAQRNSAKIAEDIAPFIIEASQGNEASIILHYRKLHTPHTTPTQPTTNSETEDDVLYDEPIIERSQNNQPHRKLSIPFKDAFLSLPLKKRLIIIIAIIVLILIVVSLVGERMTEKNRAQSLSFNALYNPMKERLESAQGLSSLNKGRALEETESAIQELESQIGKFKKGSQQYNQLASLLTELKQLRSELSGGESITNKQVVFSPDSSLKIKNADLVTVFNDNIYLIDSKDKKYALLDKNGSITTTGDIQNKDINKVIADDTYLYVLGDSLTRITLKEGSGSNKIDNTQDAKDIALYNPNTYLLTKDNSVDKYSPEFTRAEYFAKETNIDKNIVSFAIESSVYLLTDDGSIIKLTKGVIDESFDSSSIPSKISDSSTLYTREKFSHLYILDKNNAQIIKIDLNGKFVKQLNWGELRNAMSFSISSDESTAYVMISNTLYSFDL